jgi:hypothetical protein
MHSKQRGQVMPLGLALAAAGALMAVVLFNTGKVASDKTRLANAADAAAYSGLVWQARALNFQAYTNRAMVANQVAMAQAVSLRSWALYGKIATGNINRVLGGVPVINVVTNAMEVTMSTTEKIVTPITDGMLSVSNAVNSVLSKAQTAMFASSFAATPEIIKNVVKANDVRFNADTAYSIAGQARNLKDWNSFTEGYEPTNRAAMKARMDVINRSRDPFSKTRNWNFFSSYLPVFGVAKFRLEKRGETRLIEVTKHTTDDQGNRTGSETQYEWKAKDTLSLQFKWWKIYKWKRIETPIGWGEAIANDVGGNGSIEPCITRDPDDGGTGRPECPRWMGNNSTAEMLADNNVRGLNGEASREKMGATFNGIRAYRSLSQEIENEHDPRLVLRVEVEMPIDSIKSSDSFLQSDQFKAPVKAPGEVLTSISTAEVYYQRPEDTLSEEGERANGYNPYWDVRLAATSTAERLAAVGLRAQTDTSLAPTVSANVLGDYIAPVAPVEGDIAAEIDNVTAQMAALDPASAEYQRLEIRQTQLQAIQNGVATNVGGAYSDVDAIASAFGVDRNDLLNSQAYQDAIAGGGKQALEGYVNNKVAEYGLDSLETQVRDELKDALEDAAKSILAGALQGVLGQTGGAIGDFNNAVNDIQSTVEGYENTYNAVAGELNGVRDVAEGRLAALEAELEQVKQEITDKFEAKTLELKGELDDATQPILDDIAAWESELTAELEVPLTQLEIDSLNRKIDAANLQITELQGSHKTVLAQEVMDLVNSSTDTMKIDLKQAEQLIKIDNGEFEFDIDGLEVTDLDEQ